MGNNILLYILMDIISLRKRQITIVKKDKINFLFNNICAVFFRHLEKDLNFYQLANY